MAINQTIGNNLKAARLEKGLTQNDMAKKMGILQPAYARYESGKVQLNYEQIQELCDFLDITPNDLWGYNSI
ncbi:MAG: helix-turn-helix transcriptional regulator [Clostridia bacterium]|nr:helix-turn-helix transcriptional regulator [Clostridia bacterium]